MVLFKFVLINCNNDYFIFEKKLQFHSSVKQLMARSFPQKLSLMICWKEFAFFLYANFSMFATFLLRQLCHLFGCLRDENRLIKLFFVRIFQQFSFRVLFYSEIFYFIFPSLVTEKKHSYVPLFHYLWQKVFLI